jgi:hypothetical protein
MNKNIFTTMLFRVRASNGSDGVFPYWSAPVSR